jgi:hypothetical protein
VSSARWPRDEGPISTSGFYLCQKQQKMTWDIVQFLTVNISVKKLKLIKRLEISVFHPKLLDVSTGFGSSKTDIEISPNCAIFGYFPLVFSLYLKNCLSDAIVDCAEIFPNILHQVARIAILSFLNDDLA